MGTAAVFTDDNFESEVLQSDVPVLVDFWATWCGPCRQLAPVIEELAEENAGSVKVGKVDVDQNQQSAARFQIEALPTLIVFKNGEPVQRMMGKQPKSRLQAALDEAKS
jgi:thioredoxin 1